MATTNQIAEIGALLGEPSRASILVGLMDGRALTSGELAIVAGVGRAAASEHLQRLAQADLLAVEKQGRHRYYRLASPKIAEILEGMMALSVLRDGRSARVSTGPADHQMRLARSCYDHLAGTLAVAVCDSLIDRGHLEFGEDGGIISDGGLRFLGTTGMPQITSPTNGRPVCRSCLDWSERRPHIAGLVGARLLDHFLASRWLRRREKTRSLEITRAGEAAFHECFGIEVARL